MGSPPEPTVRPATVTNADRLTTVTFPEVLRATAEHRAEFLVADQEAQVVGYADAARMPTLFGGTVLEPAVDTPASHERQRPARLFARGTPRTWR
ncbi:hypothetical protein M2158_002503 [Streptomyces sp. SAI-144]|uniref:hypothetical protein n=1 Tax=Streptomyces sp. SAI-144 TaxID=2940544 RepID=UPI0024730096|nr:hypothetical protein [Streptomyces sp. SAI-144]MDH6434026.1 hypothetical protein [Streptomyces sp. SAI-144]